MVNSLPNEILGRLIPVTLGLLPDQPKVSVLIANHNYGEYIEEAIESVLCQTYPHFELVICDDGSTDTSREIIQRFVKFDSRVSLSCKENGGQASALNVAFDLSHGEIICLLDSDDLYDSHKLEEVVKAFRKDGDCGVCVHRLLPVSRERKSMGAAFPKTLANGWIGPAALRRGGFTDFPPSSGLCVRRGIAERVFPIPLALRKCADGYLINAAQFLSGITALHKVLAEYRYHAANIYAAAIPTVSSVNKRLDNIRLMHEVQKDFVRRHFGDDMGNNF
jgi:glycosyltransferase involved in cell wall biosynthesis